MTTADMVTYFCSEILDIVWSRAQDVLDFDAALKVRDIGDEIVGIIETTLKGHRDTLDDDDAFHKLVRFVNATPDNMIFDLVDIVVSACHEKYWGKDDD